jgi:hypothetical protein
MQFIEEKVKKSMGGWMGGAMSIGGRLIKVYQISIRLLHKTTV